jgi:AraC-like DNA-binding protein/mannose-6-phosphate isomerase-like protein (cupin superfamily)
LKNKEPKRLTNEHFLGQELLLQMYPQVINKHIEMHWHEFYELCFILRGRGTNVVNGYPVPLQPGSLFLLTPADFHEIFLESGSPPMELYNVIFSEELLDEKLRDLLMAERSVSSTIVPAAEIATVENGYKLIESELRLRHTGQHILVKGALERIVIGWLRGLETMEPVAPDSARVGEGQPSAPLQKGLNYIRHHFREPLMLEDAAKQARLAPNYFSDVFRRTTGISFQHYLQELRISFARSLLRASSLPDICYASGFRTMTHFERVFKQKYGLTPRAYRQESISKNS